MHQCIQKQNKKTKNCDNEQNLNKRNNTEKFDL